MEYMPTGSSLLLAILNTSGDTFGDDVKRWMYRDPAKRALMIQALYQGLPYAFTNQDASRTVGRLLARAMEGMNTQRVVESTEGAEGIEAFRLELKEHLQEQFERFRQEIP